MPQQEWLDSFLGFAVISNHDVFTCVFLFNTWFAIPSYRTPLCKESNTNDIFSTNCCKEDEAMKMILN